MTGLLEVSAEHYRAAVLPTASKRQTINTKNMILMVTPLVLLAVQIFLFCYLVNEIDTFIPASMRHSISQIETCLVFGLVFTGFLFMISNLVFSRNIVRRIWFIRENIKRCDAGLPPFLLPPDLDELSDLGADVEKLIEKSGSCKKPRLGT